MKEYVRYKSQEDFPFDNHPIISDYFMTLQTWLEEAKPSQRVRGVVGVFPSLPSKQSYNMPKSLNFLTFNTNRTAYAALKEVEDVFAEFYLKTDILPYVTPLASVFYREPKRLPSYIYKRLWVKGALIYATEE